ncbi:MULTISPECIES: multidrug effflux MFS transporter [Xenorhabdus]|uniref:multidrug effflux MFS transporter n=1 Tax=Xenorhabdus TaxID=626 RepID=UPI00064B4409|nr:MULTISPECIES: multidrug effflux MFS transporter [Xenorhabdus]KLU15101.1 multidrug transporter [Xenorhabdus griffiniae]KOP31829.1 multidrug transporter [Xenorhabdus sp. GDc328]WFQ81253.1 multidrug effflux MFS transporter [Xenorhabdus sp. SF857]
MKKSENTLNNSYLDQTIPSNQKGELAFKLVLVLGMLSAIGALSTDMYLPLFPAISHALFTTQAGVQLSLTSFMAGLAIGQLIIGPWSDAIGRRKLLLGGMVLLTVASIACSFSSSIEMLITSRFFQGAGGASGIVLTRAIVSDLSFGNKAAYYFNLILAIQGAAPIVAPLIGGVAAYFPWQVVFVFMALISLIITLLTFVYVPESLPDKSESGESKSSLAKPFLKLFQNRTYMGYTLIFSATFGALFAYISASPFIYQSMFKFTPGFFSIVFAINAGIMMFSSILSARWVGRIGAKSLVIIGVVTTFVLACLLLVVNYLNLYQFVLTTAIFMMLMFTMALIFGNAASLALTAVPDVRGAGSAVLGALQFGTASLTAFLTGLGQSVSLFPISIVLIGCGLITLFSLILVRKGDK